MPIFSTICQAASSVCRPRSTASKAGGWIRVAVQQKTGKRKTSGVFATICLTSRCWVSAVIQAILVAHGLLASRLIPKCLPTKCLATASVFLLTLLNIPGNTLAQVDSNGASEYRSARSSSARADDSQKQLGTGILFFTQAGCPPCLQMAPVVDHLISKSWPIQKINTAANPQLTRQWNIRTTPTIVVVKNGQEIDRRSEILTAHQISLLLLDAGYQADLNVLTKPTAVSPLMNFLDRLRPGKRHNRLDSGDPQFVADPTASIPVRELSPAEAKALSATVRIKASYSDRGQIVTDFGTGTIIHRTQDDILILTCGHVFRDSQGNAEIKVDLGFAGGASTQTVPAYLLLFDAGAPDVAIIAASTTLDIQPVELIQTQYQPAQKMLTFSVGCDQGKPATVRRGNYLSTRLCGEAHSIGQRPSNIQAKKYDVSGRPVVGRSGGGLFTSDGKLFGVCNAAVVEADQGVYSSIDNVIAILEKAKLNSLFDPTHRLAGTQRQDAPLASPLIQRTDFLADSGGFGRNEGQLNSAGEPSPAFSSLASTPAKRRFAPAMNLLDASSSVASVASVATDRNIATDLNSASLPSAGQTIVVMIPDPNHPSGQRSVEVPATANLLQQIHLAQQLGNSSPAGSPAQPNALPIHRLAPGISSTASIRAQSPK